MSPPTNVQTCATTHFGHVSTRHRRGTDVAKMSNFCKFLKIGLNFLFFKIGFFHQKCPSCKLIFLKLIISIII